MIKSYFNIIRLYGYTKIGWKGILPKKIYPLRASIRLTENCNSRCITCNYWRKKWEDKISTSQAIDIINKLRILGVERIRFTGGETLLRKDFFDILSSADLQGFKKITLATNGILLKKLSDKINKSKLTDLGVSIDGMPKTNDKIRGINGHFNLVMEGLKHIEKRVTIMTTLNQNSANELEELFEICEKYGFFWDFNLLDDRLFFLKNTQIDAIWPDEKAVDKILDIIRKNRHKKILSRISDMQLDYAEKYLKRKKIEEPPCYLGYTDIDIDSSGNLFSGCYVLPPVGNVLKEDINEILQSKRYQKRLEIMLRRNCKGCTCGYEVNLIIGNLPTKILEMIFKGWKK